MELIRIGVDKLKIILTDKDMLKYNIDGESFDYSNTESRKSFWSLMDDAKNSTGFNAAQSQIKVHMYPNKNGGCEIYVLKDSELSGSVLNAELIPIHAVEQTSNLPIRIGNIKKSRSICCFFDGFEELIGACRAIAASGAGIEFSSSAYKTHDGRFLLFVVARDCFSFSYHNLAATLGEFGLVTGASDRVCPIFEHGLLLCEDNAVEILSEV